MHKRESWHSKIFKFTIRWQKQSSGISSSQGKAALFTSTVAPGKAQGQPPAKTVQSGNRLQQQAGVRDSTRTSQSCKISWRPVQLSKKGYLTWATWLQMTSGVTCPYNEGIAESKTNHAPDMDVEWVIVFHTAFRGTEIKSTGLMVHGQICTFRLSLAPRCKSGREFESRDSSPRDFPGCPVINTPPSNARGRDSIPGQGTKISCTEWCGQKWKVNKYFLKRERERQRGISLVASSDKTNLEIFSSAKKSAAHRRN